MFSDRIDHATCGILTLDIQGHILKTNQTFTQFIAYTKQQIEGEHIEMLLNNANRFFFHSFIYPKLRTEGTIYEAHMTLTKRDGKEIDIMFNARLFDTDDGQFIDCVILPMEIRIQHEHELRLVNQKLQDTLEEKTELHNALEKKQQELVELNEQLKILASYDPLTNLYNRRVFVDHLSQAIDDFHDNKKTFSLCIIDIDFFKQVNDHYGHGYGDEVLKSLALTMRNFFGDNAIVARFGGEEFVVLIPDTDEDEALAITANLRETIRHETWNEINLTISIGIATMTKDDIADTLMSRADFSLYESKRNGRNRETANVKPDLT
ncbi:diguanylate cyclase (GGDEF)-like protein/PAS domain S-box-containing protein [Alkalibacillus flavidus]|uniref:Diguanylate cyclase (GGDEF)-like protein/PAS domain S-box-containing protein n=1 Tax=Alkalibacillus flavidus TaxID=546021 RepID=A0ABV2KVG8_9BACI